MTPRSAFRACLLSFLLAAAYPSPARAADHTQAATSDWTFIVSGDSRNCGDFVMPAIANGTHADKGAFYWHLGDFRAIADYDQDMMALLGTKLTLDQYRARAWDDFVEHQVRPFGTTPVFLVRGNHEALAPKTRAAYLARFAAWLDTPLLRKQRLADNPSATTPQSYYHWRMRGIEFIALDNADTSEFDPAQMSWFAGVMSRAENDPTVKTIVVGMHDALPNSISFDHGMNGWPLGESTGRKVYSALLHAHVAKYKHVYALASHSHYYASDIYNTAYWRAHGGIVHGWIIGTAGAQRYALPKERPADAKTHVYGYLRATAHNDGTVDFRFVEINESSILRANAANLRPAAIHECVVHNAQPGAN